MICQMKMNRDFITFQSIDHSHHEDRRIAHYQCLLTDENKQIACYSFSVVEIMATSNAERQTCFVATD